MGSFYFSFFFFMSMPLGAHPDAHEQLDSLRHLQITTHTGHPERRELIRSWSAGDVVSTHNALVNAVMRSGALETIDRYVLLALSQEALDAGGKFVAQIEPHDSEKVIAPGKEVESLSTLSYWKIKDTTRQEDEDHEPHER